MERRVRKKMATDKTTKKRKSSARKKAARKNVSRPKFIFRIIQRTAAVAAIIGCTILIISVQSTIAEKNSELKLLQNQISEYEAKNEDLTRILNSGDANRYMEKLAREDYGYAYPDEFRFYDTSRN